MSQLKMPEADQNTLRNRKKIARDLKRIIPNGVLKSEDELRPYETDGITVYKQLPLLVVLPETVEQVSQVLKYCHENKIKVVPRGAGTSLSGGAVPLEDGVLISMMKFNQILDIDFANRTVTAQPGVTNLGITDAVSDQGFYYAPDPSSQLACSIGGNVAENAGGVHCLKYGLTTNNILGLEAVLINGDIIRIGGKYLDSSGYDLMGVLTGSEGLLAVVTEVTVRILKQPMTARAALVGFYSIELAGQCVADIISAGIIAGGMEIIDQVALEAIQNFKDFGYPDDVDGLLIIELDGPSSEVDHLFETVKEIANKNMATYFKVSQSEEERQQFWAGRKAAFPAMGNISPDYLCMDGSIPRKKLPKVLGRIRGLSTYYGLRVANVFHAGDGNLHPLILFDTNKKGDLERAEQLGAEILKLCVEVGGVLTGEHGVGIEKRDLMGEMFNEEDLKQQQRLKCAFDQQHLLNPGKVFPTLHRCAELGRLHVHKGELRHAHLPRF